MTLRMSTVLPPMDLSSDHGGDKDSPLPDYSDPDEGEDDDEELDEEPEDEPEEDLRKAA